MTIFIYLAAKNKISILAMFLYVFTLLILRINGNEEREWKISREDVRHIEKQIQLTNNYTVKTIHTRHGDIYDCINFYNQLAFDHPLLKNQTFIPQNQPSLSHDKPRNEVFPVMREKLGLNGGGCPKGTVPIRRVTKEDLIRVKIASRSRSSSNADQSHYAICRAQDDAGYSGTQATMVTYNPEVRVTQYSAARMKLHIGPDSVEVGWRVDPKLYGDNKSRLYIHTDARNTHCFNTQCPGFVITDRSLPLDIVLRSTQPGGPNYGFDVSIAKDSTTVQWILRLDNKAIGYWPDSLFQQPGLADYVEWGGDVFGLDMRPGMGSSHVLSEDTTKDAFFSNIKVMNGPTTGGPTVDPINVKCEADVFNYEAKREGNVGGDAQFLVFYGGPPTEN